MRIFGELEQLAAERGSIRADPSSMRAKMGCGEHFPAVLRAEHEVNVQQVEAVRAGAGSGSDPAILAGRRYRLYLTPAQEEQASRVAGCCRAVHNAALEQRQLAWRMRGQGVWGVQQMAELPELKRSDGFEWLAEDGIAQSLQQTLRDLDTAYRRWLRGEGGRPRFKRKGAGERFRLPQGRDLPVRKLNRRWAEVRLAKLGWCRFRFTRPIGGEIRHATVTRDALG